MKRSLACLFLLASCDVEPSPGQAGGASLVPCALNGAAQFTLSCSVSRETNEAGNFLILSAPDGGFRRIEVAANGGGITSADGVQPARVGPSSGGAIEIAIAADRYQLPAAAPAAGQ